MTVINPPGWLQNAGATHTAEQMRNFVNTNTDVFTETSLLPKSGVAVGRGSTLKVTQTGSPSMAVLVGSGIAQVAGTESSKQGSYGVMNDADVTISITAAHPTLPRIDIIVFKVEDSQYSGSNNTSSIVVVDGTPAASPSPPSAPANSMILAEVAVAAAATQIVNANITDTRRFLSVGIFPVLASGDLPAGDIDGRYRDRLDTNVLERDSGSAWETVADPSIFTSWTSWTPVWTSTGTAPSLGNGALIGRERKIGKITHVWIRLTWGSTTTGGTGTWRFSLNSNPNFDFTLLPAISVDTSAASRFPTMSRLQTTSPEIASLASYTSTGAIGNLTATHPFTWADTDILAIGGSYQSA